MTAVQVLLAFVYYNKALAVKQYRKQRPRTCVDNRRNCGGGAASFSSAFRLKAATNLRGFGVPFQINADNGSFIEVQLYVSRDRGESWQFAWG